MYVSIHTHIYIYVTQTTYPIKGGQFLNGPMQKTALL